MGRIILLVLGVAIVAGVAYYATQSGPVDAGPAQVSGQDPAARLANVRKAAKDIEDEQQKHLDETMEKATGADSR